jgi:Flp pilus assembly protein TadB
VLFVLLALSFGIPSALLAWSYPRRAATLCRVTPATLRATPLSERLAALAEAATTGSWAERLAEELASPDDDRLRLVALNDLLDDADHELTRRDSWPRSAAWLCFAGGLLSACTGYLAGVRMELIWIVPVTVGSASACLAARRHGRRQVQRQRERIDALVQLVATDLEQTDLPQRRAQRRRRR